MSPIIYTFNSQLDRETDGFTGFISYIIQSSRLQVARAAAGLAVLYAINNNLAFAILKSVDPGIQRLTIPFDTSVHFSPSNSEFDQIGCDSGISFTHIAILAKEIYYSAMASNLTTVLWIVHEPI